MVPQWLKRARVGSKLPVRQLLRDCIYYPACETDGLIFSRSWAAGYDCCSFVYVDYSVSRARLNYQIDRNIDRGGQGLLGYELAFRRDIHLSEFSTKPYRRRIQLTVVEQSAACRRYADMERLLGATLQDVAYCEWAVFDRLPERDDKFGPERLSLLFLLADGVATYDELFGRYSTAPKCLVVKQPGHTFGYNYTNFFKLEAPLHSAVQLQKHRPEHLIFGGRGKVAHYASLVWPDYKIDSTQQLKGQALVFASRI